jgi:MFS family permease
MSTTDALEPIGTPNSTGSSSVLTVTTLLGTALVGRLPQAMSALALVRIVLDSGGDYIGAGALTSTYVVASTVGSPLLSRIIDVTGRTRAVLLGASVVSAAGFVGVVLTVQVGLWGAALCTALAGIAAPPLEPALRGLWPRLARPGPALQRLFAADTAVQEVLFILGPLVTAISGALIGAAGAVGAMAVLTVAGTALFCLHRVVAVPARRELGAHRAGSALRDGTVRTLVLVLIAAGLPIGVLTITATRFAYEAGNATLAGWALAVNAVGALLGAVGVGRLRVVPDPARALPVLLLALAVLYVPTALLGAPTALWLVFALVSGFSLPPMLTQVFALVARQVPSDVATEANAWVVSSFNVGIGGSTFLAAALTGAAGGSGLVSAVIGASAVTAIAAICLLLAGRRHRRSSEQGRSRTPSAHR